MGNFTVKGDFTVKPDKVNTGFCVDSTGIHLPDQTMINSVTSDPVSPVEGSLWYNSIDNKCKYYNGTSIVMLPDIILEITKQLVFGDSPYEVLTTEQFCICDSTSGSIIINLPTVSSNDGRIYKFKKTVAVNSVVINGNSSDLIDGETNVELDTQYSVITIECDGTQWLII